ncbi:MAG: sporulation protein YabP [Oscillospiraceae bacterium]|nr:sporulation protein YabP [Oscillospiraceae bacterium]
MSEYHSIIADNRSSVKITGVNDIDKFSENMIVLSTIMGELVIKGEDLHVTTLDAQTKDFFMTGTINSLSYGKNSVLDGPFKKIFR